METFTITDRDGDIFEVIAYDDAGDLCVRVGSARTFARAAYVTREQAKELIEHLAGYLLGTADECEQDDERPCAVDCGDSSDTERDPHNDYGVTFEPVYADQSSIAREAHHMVYGDRQDDYGHPREDFTRTAIIWTGLLQHKMAPGHHITPEDIARCMVGVKLARDVHSPKRDNRTDGIGYFITLDRLATGQ